MLHFYKTYLPDSFTGTERVIFQLSEGSAARGIDVDVLSLSRDPARNSVAIGHHFAHKARLDLDIASTGMSVSAFGRFRQLAAQADLVHYHFPWPFMDLAHFVARMRKPSLVTYHSDIVRQRLLAKPYAPLMHAFLGDVGMIVATSPQYVETSPVLRRYRNKVRVIPHGLDPGPSPIDPALVAEWRRRLGERFFLFVGQHRYYKGLRYLLEAARLTGYPVAVVGQGAMQGELAAAGLTNLHLLGNLPDADRNTLLHLCCGFVFPSHLRSEAFGLALLEAAFAGRPLVSSEIGTGTSFINVDGVTGITVPPADGVALAGAMRRLWEDPALGANFGRAASERAVRLFSSERMISSYVGLYREMLGEGSPASEMDGDQ